MKHLYLLLCLGILFLSCNNSNNNKQAESYSIKIAQLEATFDPSKFDSLSQTLIGTKLDPFTFIDLTGKTISLDKIDKPILLEATASWCKPCIAITPALNEIADQYGDQVELILLTHDTPKKAARFAKKFDSQIKIIPSSKEQDPGSLDKIAVGGFKQLFPFPTTYFIDKDKIIVDVKVGAEVPASSNSEEVERVKRRNVERLKDGIGRLL